jgi:hypothetical protein
MSALFDYFNTSISCDWVCCMLCVCMLLCFLYQSGHLIAVSQALAITGTVQAQLNKKVWWWDDWSKLSCVFLPSRALLALKMQIQQHTHDARWHNPSSSSSFSSAAASAASSSRSVLGKHSLEGE